jgi:agmatinase
MQNNIEYVPQEEGFLGIKEKYFEPGEEKVLVIPYGLESSVTYGHGTRIGPRAIIKASRQVETFDEEHWCEIYKDIGIATMKEAAILPTLMEALYQFEAIIEDVLQGDKFPLILGGEHSITAGAIPSFLKKYPDLAILHFDAHAGLKEIKKDEDLSQASVLRKVMDESPVSHLVSCGIRNISAQEAEFYEKNQDKIDIHFAQNIKKWDINEIIKPLKGKNIYLTVDVDSFDSSLMQATGMPEPGGLFWNDIIDIIRLASKECNIVGADIMELAPIKTLHSCDFLAAKLAYKILGYVFQNKSNKA